MPSFSSFSSYPQVGHFNGTTNPSLSICFSSQSRKKMVSRTLLFCMFISTIYISSVLSDDFLLENDASPNSVNPPSMIAYPYDFISLICQQPEQYPSKITRKLCSNYFQSGKQQQQQQRGKRVGWTISV